MPPAIPNADELPLLTDKQMRFVEGIVSGKTGSDAYRDAFDTSNMLPTTISASASTLRREPKVEAWIRAWHIAHMGSGVLSKEQHLRELEAIRELSKEQGDLKSAVAAEHLRGKASGLYVERSEVTVYDPAAILAQIANIDPSIAARLAERFNIALPALLAGQSSQPADMEGVSAGPVRPSRLSVPSDVSPDDHQAGDTQGEATP